MQRLENEIQRFKGRYGIRGISVDVRVPTYAIRRRLGSTHVSTSFEDVETMVREAIAERRAAGDTDWTERLERETVRFALWQHRMNRGEYAFVMGSH